MLERIEKSIERAIDRAEYRLLARIHPALARLDSEKDRRWVVWYGLEGTPSWQRAAAMLIIGLFGPALMTALLFILAWQAPWFSLDAIWPFLLLIGPPLGFFIAAVIVESIRGRGIARRYFEAMRIFGHDVCPGCGYDMQGHALERIESRTCPECGSFVGPLRKPVTPPRG